MIFVLTFAGFCLAFFLLSIGYIFARKIIKGSCGSIDDLGEERVCKCEKPCFARRMRMKRQEAQEKQRQIKRDLGLE
ncbi:MAG: (Na+)-NQR maturation NqrM [Succinivibrionaceae bacterium]|nr:(Na+)-NQR maturation NqrM [Succinivibrionaceae bacterium]